ncbi:hypothetical protein FA15DRAFT_638420 [Coprinopsis marcescibilis]|uniref:Up-regulated during septation protein 1 domain-containing protein n=1 Tax=Coprinopsis marcescibilis TaxID=230819 RepID=A0A5C3L036_COPMA|nr:hypothetical protein FA15DRAFT_638420 [Coprinopsis marcescibilis]
MNFGVRKLFGVGALSSSASGSAPSSPSDTQQPQPPPPLPKGIIQTITTTATGPSWPPTPLRESYDNGTYSSPKATSAALLKLQKEGRKPSLSGSSANNGADDADRSWGSLSRSSSNSNHRSMGSTGLNGSPAGMSRRIPAPSVEKLEKRESTSTSTGSETWGAPSSKRISGQLNTRDELLMSLMASEAVVDSREYSILGTEEVEDLKKEYTSLSSRLTASTRKLALETKIRDAAASLSRINKSGVKQNGEQLDAANGRVDAAQKDVWQLSERANEIHKRLLEHRAAVLSFSVRNMEKKLSPSMSGTSEDSGYESSNRSTLLSPATADSVSSFSSTTTRSTKFDGAHLFAGHADSVVPKRQISNEAASKEISSLEEKLKAATAQLAESSKRQGEMKKELSHLQLEKQQVETMKGMELQNAEETIAALEAELPKLEQLKQEKAKWDEEAQSLRAQILQLETTGGSDSDVHILRRELAEKDREIREIKEEWNEERAGWDAERASMEEEKIDDLTRLQEEMDRLRDADEQVLQAANQELNATLNSLRALCERFDISVPPRPRDSSISIMRHLINAVTSRLDDQRLQIDRLEKAREPLLRELEDAKRERDSAKRDTMASARSFSPPAVFTPPQPQVAPENSEYGPDVQGAKFIEALQPIWAILPSPEARAARVGSGNSRYRINGAPPPTPASASIPSPGGPNNAAAASISDLDVRSLKTLYDPRKSSVAPNNGQFTLESFINRVNALVLDDRALIERLIRFAQAHDLLKKNAERAQKLAQDANLALDTYSKQVKQLEGRNEALQERMGVMQSEVHYLNEAIERNTAEKRQLEALVAERAKEIGELNEANNTLSARTLTLAEEAANAPNMARRQAEEQQLEVKAKEYEAAQDEIEAMRNAEQGQRIALLDELNSMQTENGQLRAQIRTLKAQKP